MSLLITLPPFIADDINSPYVQNITKVDLNDKKSFKLRVYILFLCSEIVLQSI